jgi:radical SAM superfamily enzyme YgiQ (UPF0313 family)
MASKFIHSYDISKHYSKDELKGLNVVFINMPLRESAMPVVAPEGPAILAGVLLEYGVNTTILDLNAYRINDKHVISEKQPSGRHLTFLEAECLFRLHIEKNGSPDVVAFSGIITTLKWQEEFAKIVRKILPDCFLVTGNGLATEISTGLFKWIPELDAIARSEGDDVILVIAKDAKIIKEHGLESSIDSGLLSPYYAGIVEGSHRFVYEGNRPGDLNRIPYPAWELLEEDTIGISILENYINVPLWGIVANNSSATPFTMERSINTVSSRGCPYTCTFCYRGAQGERNYGVRDGEHLALQIKHHVEKYNIDFIGFLDDNFAVQKKRVQAMPEIFREHDIDIKWGTHMRMDEADDRVFQMSEAGCIYIGFGAESASEKTLIAMEKGGHILRNGLVEKTVDGKKYSFPKTMVDAVINCHKSGIHANCTWIMGYPGETLEELKTSVAFIKWQQDIIENNEVENNCGYSDVKTSINRRMFTATAYPGTAMFKDDHVKKVLNKNFGITFQENSEPVCDDAFHSYVLELDDATKMLIGSDGKLVNYSKIDDEKYKIARELIMSGKVEEILSL